MKTLSKTSRSKKNLVIIATATLLILTVGSIIAYYKLTTPNSKETAKTQDTSETPRTNDNPATPQQQDAGSNQKQDVVNRDQNQPTTPTTSLTVTITAANQNGSLVNIRSLVNTVSSTGNCSLSITSGSSKITKTSGLQALAESSTCQGFDIPVSSLPKGTWHITLSVTAGSAKGSTQKDIVVN